MASNTETARAIIDIDGKQAESELEKLKQDAKELREMLRKAQEANDLNLHKKVEQQLKANTSAQNQFKKAVFDTENVLKNLNGSTLRELNKTYSTLRTRMLNMKQTTDEERAAYSKLQRDMVAVDAQRKKLTAGIRAHESSTSSLGLSVRSLIGGIGRLAAGLGVATGAFELAKGVINTTDTVSDRFNETIGGIKSGLHMLAQSIATMDFSNFINNMREAVKAGKEYVAALDGIEDRKRGMAIVEADDAKRIAELDIISKDVTKSFSERQSALIALLAIEQKNANMRYKIAKDTEQTELKNAAVFTGLTQTRIREMLKENATRYTQVDAAKKYLGAIETLEKAALKKNSNMFSSLDKKELAEAKRIIQTTTSDVKNNAKELLQLGKISETEYNRLSTAISESGMASANYLIENQKRITRLNKIRKGELTESEQDYKAYLKTVVTAYEEIDKKIAETDKKIKDALAQGDTPLAKKLIAEKKAAQELKDSIDEIQKALENGIDLEALKNSIIAPLNAIQPEGFKTDTTTNKGVAAWVKKGLGVLGGKRAGGAMGPSEDDKAREDAEAEYRKNWQDAEVEMVQTVSDTIFQIGEQRRQAELNAELDKLDKAKERELSNDKLTIDQRNAIEEKYRKKELAAKNAALDKKKKADTIQAIINGALAITKTFAEWGWPFGIPMAAAQAVATAAQVALIQKQEIPQYASGKYDIMGQSDGKLYKNVPFTGAARTGIYKSPALISEQGAELIVDAKTTRNLQMNYPEIIEAIRYAKVPQHYDGTAMSSLMTNERTLNGRTTRFLSSIGHSDMILQKILKDHNEILMEHTEILQRMKKDGIKAKVVYRDIEEFTDKVKETESRTGL